MKTTTKSTKQKPLTEEKLIECKIRLEELKQTQELAREEELKIREYLADKIHTGDEGTQSLKLGGLKVSVTRTLRREISREDAERLVQDFPRESVEALRWKPEVATKFYREHQEMMDSYIVTKSSPASISFK